MPTSSRRPTFGQHPTSSSRQTPVPTFSLRQTPVPTSSRRHTPMPTSSRRHPPLHDHTMEEASQTTDDMCLDTAYDIGSMAHSDAGPSHTSVHAHTSRSPLRFMRTLGRPTPGAVPPKGVHTDFIQTQISTPPLELSHIEDRPRRPQWTRTHPPDCGIRHGTIV